MGILLEAGSKMFVFLALMFAMAAAAPNKQTDPEWAGEPTYGEWVEVVEQPDQREPALAANWWDWDHEAVTDGIFKNENIILHVGLVHRLAELLGHNEQREGLDSGGQSADYGR